MAYVPLGGRPVRAALDQSGLNPGGFYTAVFDDQIIGATVPRYELYHLYLRSTVLTGQATTVDVYLNTLPWDTTLIGQRNSWDPSQPALMQPGDVLYVCFNVPVTMTPAPYVVCWFRYEQS